MSGIIDQNEISKRTVGDFRIGKTIGKGSYAIVKKSIDKILNEKRALKVYSFKKLQTLKRK